MTNGKHTVTTTALIVLAALLPACAKSPTPRPPDQRLAPYPGYFGSFIEQPKITYGPITVDPTACILTARFTVGKDPETESVVYLHDVTYVQQQEHAVVLFDFGHVQTKVRGKTTNTNQLDLYLNLVGTDNTAHEAEVYQYLHAAVKSCGGSPDGT
jgi:hypothetical protein